MKMVKKICLNKKVLMIYRIGRSRRGLKINHVPAMNNSSSVEELLDFQFADMAQTTND